MMGKLMNSNLSAESSESPSQGMQTADDFGRTAPLPAGTQEGAPGPTDRGWDSFDIWRRCIHEPRQQSHNQRGRLS